MPAIKAGLRHSNPCAHTLDYHFNDHSQTFKKEDVMNTNPSFKHSQQGLQFLNYGQLIQHPMVLATAELNTLAKDT